MTALAVMGEDLYIGGSFAIPRQCDEHREGKPVRRVVGTWRRRDWERRRPSMRWQSADTSCLLRGRLPTPAEWRCARSRNGMGRIGKRWAVVSR